MPQAKKPRRKRGTNRNPIGKLIALKRIMLSRQRMGFVGAIKYHRARKHAETISLIMRQCLRSCRRDPSEAGKNLQSVLEEQGVRLEEFKSLCSAFWPSNLSAGDRVFSILKAAGFQGNIDDLWLSVYGM